MDGDGRRALRNIRLVLAYDGAPYLGWQVQPQGPTVQSVLQEALRLVTGAETTVKGSGRTDAGVHALGQVANFRTASPMSPAAFVRALNGVLPAAVAVLAADEVDPSFDSQFSAVEKTYRYRVLTRAERSPFEEGRAWHVHRQLDRESISSAASMLLGTHDFSSFRASGCAAGSPVRTLLRCDLIDEGDLLLFELAANGFLRHMVRNIVGTLVDVGRGRIPPARVAGILGARDRTRAGRAAPAHGLYLVRVVYP
jgi:tRNA pseudouridine38-40 synthase